MHYFHVYWMKNSARKKKILKKDLVGIIGINKLNNIRDYIKGERNE